MFHVLHLHPQGPWTEDKSLIYVLIHLWVWEDNGGGRCPNITHVITLDLMDNIINIWRIALLSFDLNSSLRI